MTKKTYGKTGRGHVIDDERVRRLAEKAADGSDVSDTIERRGGRPAIGSALHPSSPCGSIPTSVRNSGGAPNKKGARTPTWIRDALRRYLRAS